MGGGGGHWVYIGGSGGHCEVVLGQYYNHAYRDYCELHIADISIYWVVDGIGIKLVQEYT